MVDEYVLILIGMCLAKGLMANLLDYLRGKR